MKYVLAVITALIPLIGTILFSWDAMDILQVYMIEGLILGGFDLLRMKPARETNLIPLVSSAFYWLPLLWNIIAIAVVFMTYSILVASGGRLEFHPWSNYWGYVLVTAGWLGITYFWDLKFRYAEMQNITRDEIAAVATARSAVIFFVLLFCSFFLFLVGDIRVLVLVMTLFRGALDCWHLSRHKIWKFGDTLS